MSSTNDGPLKRWRAFEHCLQCDHYVDLAPGALSDDGTVEIRTCDDCDSDIHTTPYFTCRSAEAETFHLG